MKKYFLILFCFFFLWFLFLSKDVLAVQTLECTLSETEIPLGGSISGTCTAKAGYAWYQCLTGGKVTGIDLYFHTESFQGPNILMDSYDCNSSTCTISFTSGPINRAGEIYIIGCVDRKCISSDTRCSSILGGIFNVLPGYCGDGEKNQIDEECDGSDFDGKECSDFGFSAGDLKCTDECKIDSSGCSNLPPPEDKEVAGYDNPLIWENIIQFLKYIFYFIYQVGLALSVLFIIIGAFLLVISRGDPIKTAKGKRIIFFAVVGFILTLMSYGIFTLFKSVFRVKENIDF